MKRLAARSCCGKAGEPGLPGAGIIARRGLGLKDELALEPQVARRLQRAHLIVQVAGMGRVELARPGGVEEFLAP